MFKSRASKYFAIYIIAALLAHPVARAESTVFNDDNQRIMLVKLNDGTRLSDSLIAYPQGTDWYLPLGEVSQTLGLAVAVKSAEGVADGFVLEQANVFHLKLHECEVNRAGTTEKFPCTDVQANDGDLYVKISLLQKWFPIELQVNTFSSEIVVVPRRSLPVQDRAEREKRAAGLKSSGADNPGYPFQPIPYSNLEGPFIDQQLTFERGKQNGEGYGSVRQDTTASGEVFGLETSGYIGGLTNHYDRARLTMAKRSPDANLLGSAHARDIELLNFTLPSLPLIGGSAYGLGLMVSSFPLYTPDNFSTQTLQGDLPTGWEVELYQNDTLIDRQISSSNNRYEFNNVPLLYGINRFRFIFYGPQGQRVETTKTYNVDRSLQQPGKTNYRAAFGDVAADDKRVVMQVDTSVSSAVTAHAGFARLVPVSVENQNSQLGIAATSINYGLLGLSARAGPAVLQTSFASSENNGTATQVAAQTSWGRTNLNLYQTYLHHFISDLFNPEPNRALVTVTRAELAAVPFSQPAMRFTLEAQHGVYDNDEYRDNLIQRTSLLTGRVLWNNEFNNQSGDSHSFGGNFSSSLLLNTSQIRVNSVYNDVHVVSASAEYQKSYSSTSTWRTAIAQKFQEQIAELTGALTHSFSKFMLTSNVTYDTHDAWAIGLVVSYSAALDPSVKKWHALDQPVSATGAATVRVFLDENRNGIFDAGDKPLKDVGIQISQRDALGRTDADGRLFIQQIPTQQPTDLNVLLGTLTDPYQKPVERGVRFYAREGKTAQFDIPVQTYSDFSGTISYPNHTRRGIEIELIDQNGRVIATTRAESDGYFLFDRLAPGTYRLELKPDSVHSKTNSITPQSRSAEAEADGSSTGDLDFSITEK